MSAFIEKAGTGGGLFRKLLADGCADVARLTGDLATEDLAVAARHCAQTWTEAGRAGIEHEVDVRTRLERVASAVSLLPTLELQLAEALESVKRPGFDGDIDYPEGSSDHGSTSQIPG